MLVDPDGRKFVSIIKIGGEKYKFVFDGKKATIQSYKRGEVSGEVKNYEKGSNKFVDCIIKSYNYIVDKGADIDGALQKVASSDKEIKVVKRRRSGWYAKGTIGFDFKYGLKLKNSKNEKSFESPAVGFWSEVYHAYIDNFDSKSKSKFKNDDDLHSQEENYVHVIKGNKVVDILRTKGYQEGKRDTYEDAWKLKKTKSLTAKK
jgi:hypothetical protein